MTLGDLPPYPIGDDRPAGEAPGHGDQGRTDQGRTDQGHGDGPPPHRTVPRPGRRALAFAAGAVLLGLAVVAALSWAGAREARQAADDAERELAAAQRDLDAAEAALGASILQPGTTPESLDSPPMAVMGAAVQRLQESTDPDVAALYEATFGTQLRTTAWARLDPVDPERTVLAKVDDAAQPSTLWVSLRDRSTVDPGVPKRDPCLAIDVGGLLESVALGRPGPADIPGGPLRWWPDVYRFVPESECGRPD